jgi:signal transduction histidine kinase
VGRQLSRQLDQSLDDATLELARVARSPELLEGGDSALLDALDALRIPQRTLYLLDSVARPVSPTIADPWIRGAAIEASRRGSAKRQYKTNDDRTLRLVARRFRAANGRLLIAGAIADQYELEDRYTDLIGAFSLAALVAVVLVGIGGSILTRKSMVPIDATIENMRRFMADAAHELKTPVAILRTNAEVALQRTRDPEDYRSALEAVESESRRLGGIVEHMLMLARADAGTRRVDGQLVYVDDIVDACLSVIRTIADQKAISIVVSRFEEASISGDPVLIRELVMILLDNALKFTNSGGTVTVNVGSDLQHSTLVVADTGIGIGDRDLPRIFDRFYRARDGAGIEGAGLGLSIARWIADQHGAQIEIDSSPGKGTTVRVVFPLAEANLDKNRTGTVL